MAARVAPVSCLLTVVAAAAAAVLLSAESGDVPLTQTGPANVSGSASGVVVGQVLDGVGRRPVAGAFVTITGRGGTTRVIAEGEGRFAFRDLPPGDYSLTATRSGWTAGEFGRRRPGGEALPLRIGAGQRLIDAEILLWRLGAISGTVRDEIGEPIVGIEVRALQRGYRTGDARWSAVRSASTDDRGEYRLGLLPPGEYTVVVPETHASYPADLAGRVGAPVIAGDLAMMSMIPPGPGRELGRPYAYRTTFYPDALTSSSATTMTIGPSDERSGVDFQLRPVRTFTITGIVTKDGHPAAAPLRLLRAAPDARGRVKPISDILVAMTSSENDGRFRFPVVPAGQFVLIAEDAPAAAKLAITLEDADVSALSVNLVPGFVVRGRFDLTVLPASMTKALQQAQVRVEALDPRDATSRTGRVDAEGQFAATGLMPSDYTVTVSNLPPNVSVKAVTVGGRDVTDRAFEVASDVANVVVSLTTRTTEVGGRVAGAGEGLPPSVVVVFPGAGFPLLERAWAGPARRFRRVPVGPDGRYVVRGLPEGEYLFAAIPEAQSDDWMSASVLEGLAGSAAMVSLRDGETRGLELRVVQVRR